MVEGRKCRNISFYFSNFCPLFRRSTNVFYGRVTWIRAFLPTALLCFSLTAAMIAAIARWKLHHKREEKKDLFKKNNFTPLWTLDVEWTIIIEVTFSQLHPEQVLVQVHKISRTIHGDKVSIIVQKQQRIKYFKRGSICIMYTRVNAAICSNLTTILNIIRTQSIIRYNSRLTGCTFNIHTHTHTYTKCKHNNLIKENNQTFCSTELFTNTHTQYINETYYTLYCWK